MHVFRWSIHIDSWNETNQIINMIMTEWRFQNKFNDRLDQRCKHWSLDDLHWIWLSDELGLWRHMHMSKPAKTAPTAKKQLTDIRTNHVNSNPSNVVDLLSGKKWFFFTNIRIITDFTNYYFLGLCWLTLTEIFIGIITTVIHLITNKVWMDAQLTRSTQKWLADMF